MRDGVFQKAGDFMMYSSPQSCAWYRARVVLYIRVSTDEQARHGYSLAAQREALREFCELYQCQIVAEYSDDGVSARKEISRRPGLLQVLERVKAGGVDYVLFIKLDRWFRSVREYYRVQDVLDAAGTNWKAILEEYDTSTTNGRLNLNIRLSVAQDESDRTADRIKFVFAERVKNGGAIYGSGSLPYGLEVRDHRVVVDQSKAPAVRGLFDYYETANSSRMCQQFLLEQYGVSLPVNTVRRMLRNSLYCGRYRDNPAYCEAIITAEQFDRVQEVISRRAAGHTRQSVHQYVFSGLLRCPECGCTLKAYPQHDYKFGRVYLRYRCSTCWTDRRCGWKSTPWEPRIEDWLLDHIQPQLDDYLARFDVQEQQRRRAVVDVGAIQRKLSRLQDLYVDGMIDREAYNEKYTALARQHHAAQEAQQAPAGRDLSTLRELLAGDFRAIYDTLTAVERHTLWASVIDHIVVNCADYGAFDLSVFFLP